MLKRFLAYYKPHMRIFVLDMLASLIVSLVGIVYPIVTRTMLNTLIPETLLSRAALISAVAALLSAKASLIFLRRTSEMRSRNGTQAKIMSVSQIFILER